MNDDLNFEKITCCRICKNKNLITILDLGNQFLGSRFPKFLEEDPIRVPLILVKCDDIENKNNCGLLQLDRNTSSSELYLHQYGYRSGLNTTMIKHLETMVKEIESFVILKSDDMILDIGSNDSTLLKCYSNGEKVGIDPTGAQFKQYYPDNITLIPDFFNKNVFENKFGDKKVKIITTISMFYDLPDPISFVEDIKSILSEDGLWITEQSYCKTMLENNSFDTICHEHLEYYTMKQFQFIANKVGLKIIKTSLNSCNGGSFRLYLVHENNENYDYHELLKESDDNLDEIADFIDRCEILKNNLYDYLIEQKSLGKSIYLYGASTKGNTLLQYYNLDKNIITAAAERNTEKYGCRTPGTNIPIISEAQMRAETPDFLLVLPWHFKQEFLIRELDYMKNGGRIIFPLPQLEIYYWNGTDIDIVNLKKKL